MSVFALLFPLFAFSQPFTAKLLDPNGESWGQLGYPDTTVSNVTFNKYNYKYIKGRLGYLSNDAYGGKNIWNFRRITTAEGKEIIENGSYFRRTCLSISYDKDWVTWPDAKTKENAQNINNNYPTIVYAYSVPNECYVGYFDVYYYTEDPANPDNNDSYPIVEGKCKKLFKTGSTEELMPEYADISGVSYWQFQNITSIEEMFANCTNLENIELHGEFSGNIKNAFFNCTSLERINIDRVTTRLTDLSSLFSGCTNIKTASLNGSDDADLVLKGDFSGVTTMANMFNGCTSLEKVKLV